MKYVEHDGYCFNTNENWVLIIHKASGNNIRLSRHLLHTALDLLGEDNE